MPPAARVGDFHACPLFNGPQPHVGGPVLQGEGTVLIDGQVAAVVGSVCVCIGPPDMVAQGSATVFIGGKAAARVGDMTVHAGVIMAGSPSVIIGG
jgi:uncharacterized Zn-binding protein involved in type VI secretion